MTSKSTKKNQSKQKSKTSGTSAKTSGSSGNTTGSKKGAQNFTVAPDILTQTMEAMMPNFTDYEELSKEAQNTLKEGSEAFAKSGTLAGKSFENYFKTMSTLMQDTAQRQSEMFEELLKCKSLNDLGSVQQKYAQKNIDEALDNLGKITNVTVQICTETLEPIQSHFTNTYKKFGDKIAA